MCVSYDTGDENRRTMSPPWKVQSLVIVVYPLFDSMHSQHRSKITQVPLRA